MTEDRNPLQARFMRKQQKDGGYDEQQEEQDKKFKSNFEQALKAHSKKATTQDLEKQVEYFGYKIQPFNMKRQEEMGQIDEQGFFVFNNKRRHKDAWLESLNDNENEGTVDKLRKIIKEEHRQQNVYQGDKKINQDYVSEQEEERDPQQSNQPQKVQQKDKFDGKQIKILLSQLLPFGTNANQYMKSLKKQKNNELYEKILYLCNEYVTSTGQYDIFTKKKQDLEQQLQQNQEPEVVNWNDESQQQNSKEQLFPKEEKQESDDIF